MNRTNIATRGPLLQAALILIGVLSISAVSTAQGGNLCGPGVMVCGSGGNGICISGECFVEVPMAPGVSGNTVCEAENLICDDVPVLSPPEAACLAFHPSASVSSDVNGWKEGVYCNGDVGLACQDRFNDCHHCPACGDNLSCGTSNSTLLTALYARCVPIPLNVTIELVQVVSNGTETDLVAGKNLVVRAFAENPDEFAPQLPAQAQLCVDGDGFCDGLFFAFGTLFPTGTVFTDTQRRNADNSLNFFITGPDADKLLTPGTHTFEVEVLPQNPGAFGPLLGESAGNFLESGTIGIFGHPIKLLDSNSHPVLGNNNIGILGDHIIASYPIDESNLHLAIGSPVVFPEFSPLNINGPAAHELNRFVEKLYLIGKAKGTPTSFSFGAGIVPDFIDGMDTLFATAGAAIGGVGAYVPPNLDILIARDSPLIPISLSHEVAHIFDLGEEYCFDPPNPFPCGPGSMGSYSTINPPPQVLGVDGDQIGNFILEEMRAFDVNEFIPGRRVIFGPPGTPAYCLMAGGPPNASEQWMTTDEYSHLFTGLTGMSRRMENGISGPGTFQGVSNSHGPAPRNIVSILGSITQAGTGTLDPLLIQNSEVEFPRPTGTDYTIEIRDNLGGLLDTVGFDVSFDMEVFAENIAGLLVLDETSFSVTVDLPADATSVRLLQDQTILAERLRSPNAPEVILTFLSLTGDTVVAGWMGSDADGDNLTYTLFYSPDGLDEELVGLDVAANTLEFDIGNFGATELSFVRVRANDGFNFTDATGPLLPFFSQSFEDPSPP